MRALAYARPLVVGPAPVVPFMVSRTVEVEGASYDAHAFLEHPPGASAPRAAAGPVRVLSEATVALLEARGTPPANDGWQAPVEARRIVPGDPLQDGPRVEDARLLRAIGEAAASMYAAERVAPRRAHVSMVPAAPDALVPDTEARRVVAAPLPSVAAPVLAPPSLSAAPVPRRAGLTL